MPANKIKTFVVVYLAINTNSIVSRYLLRYDENCFHAVARIPNCVGAVEGILIPIKGMSGLEEPV